MQIVINISEDLYKSIVSHKCKSSFQQKIDYEALKNAIEDGTVLSNSVPIVDCEHCSKNKGKQGHWIEYFNEKHRTVAFKCSECGKEQPFGTDFCWHCGSYNGEI